MHEQYLRSEILAKPDKPAAHYGSSQKIVAAPLRETKSVTKIEPFRFRSRERKVSSLQKKIRVAIEVERVDQREQKLGTPTLPILQKKDSKAFWSNLRKEYDNLLQEKQ